MAVRTVSVNLEAKAAKYRAEVQASTKDTAKLAATADKTGKSIDDMAAQANEAGRKLDKMAAEAKGAGHEVNSFDRQLGQLDRQIDETAVHLAALNREFAATGDKGLFKQIRSDRSTLTMLQRIRKEIVGVGDDSDKTSKKIATTIETGVGDSLGAIPSQLRGAAIVAGVSIAAIMAPEIGAVIGGAVLGGVGAGGIIGGILLASKDDRVRHAAERVGEEFMAALTADAGVFVGPLLASVDDLRQAGLDLTNVLGRGFAHLAPLVKVLAKGAEGLAHNLGPGLEKAFTAAEPAIRALAHELPALGDALGGALSEIADSSDGAVEGLISILHLVEEAVTVTGDFVSTMSDAYDWLVRTGNATTEFTSKWLGWIPIVGDFQKGLHSETQDVIDGLDKAKNSSDDYAGSLMHVSTAEEEAAQKAKELKDAFDKLFGIQMSLDEANLRYQESIDKTVETLTKSKRTLDINSKAGRDNKQAVLDQIQAIEDLRQANLDNNMSIDDANRKYEGQLDSLRKTLLHLGYNKAAVDALIGSYKKVPAKAQTQVDAPGLANIQSRLAKVNDQLNHMDGRVVHTTVLIDQQTHREDARQYRRWGGITTHAATGYLRDAAVYSSVASGARYAFAEPATGGEAFVPRRGDYGRSMSILSQAASWYGATLSPGGGSTPVIVNVYASAPNANGLTRELINTIQYTVRTVGGGDVNYLAGRR